MSVVMRVVVTGTGDAGGLPVAGCRCARCARADRDGTRRCPAAALVDGVLALGAVPSAGARGYRVRSLAGGCLDVAGPTGRLLWAPYGVSDGSDAGGGYDVVLLGGAGGDVTAPSVGHRLAALRARGAVTGTTTVAAIGIGHAAPGEPELSRRLGAWGVRVCADGAVLPAPAPAGRTAAPGRILVLGGARSGKSAEAERLLAAEPAVTYVATGAPGDDHDPEWAQRVATHRARRPAGWRTVETLDVAAQVARARTPVLVDCLSGWLTQTLDEVGGWAGAGADELAARVDRLAAAWRCAPQRTGAVSSETGSGVVPATRSGRVFRDALGRLNQRIATECDEVLLVVAGQVLQVAP